MNLPAVAIISSCTRRYIPWTLFNFTVERGCRLLSIAIEVSMLEMRLILPLPVPLSTSAGEVNLSRETSRSVCGRTVDIKSSYSESVYMSTEWGDGL